MATETSPENPFLIKIQEYILAHYEPASSITEAEVHLSTEEIYGQLQQLYPSIEYNREWVADTLFSYGFKFTEVVPMRFEWLLKRIS